MVSWGVRSKWVGDSRDSWDKLILTSPWDKAVAGDRIKEGVEVSVSRPRIKRWER